MVPLAALSMRPHSGSSERVWGDRISEGLNLEISSAATEKRRGPVNSQALNSPVVTSTMASPRLCGELARAMR